MKNTFKPAELQVLPSIHDCEVSKVILEGSDLVFIYKNISNYDSITNQNIEHNNLRLTFTIEDFDFSTVRFTESKIYTEKVMTRLKSVEYKLKHFVDNEVNKEYPISTLDILVSWKNVVMKNVSKNGDLTFELFVSKISYEWYN